MQTKIAKLTKLLQIQLRKALRSFIVQKDLYQMIITLWQIWVSSKNKK